MSHSPDRSTLWAAGGYLAIVALLFHRVFVGDVVSPAANLWTDVPFRSDLRENFDPHLNGVQGDVWRTFEPWHIYQFQSARDGRFPLWNPHSFCGFPFHANAQAAMLSPFHWVYFLVDPKWAAGPVAMAKLWITGFAAYCLARRLGMTPVGGFVAGLAWMLSAFNVRWLLWGLSSAAAWLPVLLIAIEAILERPSVRRVALGGLAATALQLSGHPECQFHVGVLSGLYALVRLWLMELPRSAKFGRFALCASVHVLGLLGAAVSLVPFLEQMRDSADWYEALHARTRMMPLEGLLGALAPDHFGRPRASRHYQGPLNYVEAGLYIGLVPLALAITAGVSIVIRRRRAIGGPAGPAIVVFGVMALFCLIVILGLPVANLVLQHLPLFSKADTMRLLLGLQFAGAMLAGAAWTQLVHVPSRLATRTLFLTCLAFACIVAALIYWPDPRFVFSHPDGIKQLLTDPSVPAPLDHRSLRTLVSLIVAMLAACWALACGFSVRFKTTHDPSIASRGGLAKCSVTLLLLTVADLFWVAYGFNPVVPRRVVFPDPPARLTAAIDAAGDGRLIATDEILAPNVAMIYGFRDLRGYDFPLDQRLSKLFHRLGWGPGMMLLPRHQATPCLRDAVQSVCDKTCVRILYTERKLTSDLAGGIAPCLATGDPAAGTAWTLILGRDSRARDAIYHNPTAYARAYFAESVSHVSAETALDALFDLKWDLRQHSFVEEPLEDLSLESASAARGTATIECDAAELVTIRTRSDTGGLLVLSDRYDPGWRVELDGRPTRRVVTNYLFRGVVVPAGEHVVRWSYLPASFIWGGVISGTALLLMLVLLFTSDRAGLQRRAEQS